MTRGLTPAKLVSSPQDKAPNAAPPFKRQAAEILHDVQTGLAGVLASIPASRRGEVRKPADLERVLGIRRMLAWQVFRIAHASDPLTEVARVPGKGAMKKFFDAADAQGVPSNRIESAARALEAFDRLVRKHAGDRRAFSSLISGVTEEGDDSVDYQAKRSAFRANSHLWGAQTQAEVTCRIFLPKSHPRTCDVIDISGFVGVHCSRHQSSLILTRHSISHTNPHEQGTRFRKEALDPTAMIGHDISFLPAFCSQPLPEVRLIDSAPGQIATELVKTGVGKASALTLFLGHAWRNLISPYSDEQEPLLSATSAVRLPSEVLIHDVLIHEDAFGPVGILDPTVHISDMMHAPDGTDELMRPFSGMLVLRERATYLGSGSSVLHNADVPVLPDLVETVCHQQGVDASRLRTYRCRVEYPVLGSRIRMTFKLPRLG